MRTRLPSLLEEPILFAHRGGRTNEREHSRAAFEQAMRLGATGLHADAWLTADGHVVLDRTGLVRRVPRRRIRDRVRADLDTLLGLDDLLAIAGVVPVWLRVDEPEAAATIVETAQTVGRLDRIWLAHPDLDVLAAWRDLSPTVRLVNATTLDAMAFGPERRAGELAAARVDAVALPEAEWTGGHVTLFHRFEVLAFAVGAHFERQLARAIDMGIDGVSGDHVERMAAVAATFR